MPDYSNTVIYKITSGDDLYIGSTCNFTRRKNSHKSAIYNDKIKDYKTKLYKTIRKNDGEWEMKPIVEFPCKTKLEKVTEEERYRVLLGANLNSEKCSTTKEERKEYMRLYNLNYRNGEKRDELLEKKNEYYDKNKEVISLKAKEYRSNNKETLKERKQQYYEKNKEEIILKSKEKVVCECGCILTKSHLAEHIKSAKHIKLMEPKKENLVL